MIGRLLQHNPDLPPTVAFDLIRDSYRRMVDRRLWYGLMYQGQVAVPNAYVTGTVNVGNVSRGADFVAGNGTNWDPTMIGFQFRIGFSTPIYTIIAVLSPTLLQINLPWADAAISGVGYMIFQNIVNLGERCKRVLAMVNQKQGYRLFLNTPQEVLNIYDTWRQTTGWTFLLANTVPSADGIPQFELYPAPTFQQTFPFLAYQQPNDLAEDDDRPALFVRADVILYGALPAALTFRGPKSSYYDTNQAMMYQRMHEAELSKMEAMDDNLYSKDLLWEFERWPFSQFGADWMQSHDPDLWIQTGYGGSYFT